MYSSGGYTRPMPIRDKYLNFFIDELGSPSPQSSKQPIYILSGILLTEHASQNLETISNQIKFKYWNKTEVVFHSREIGRKQGDFKILNDNSISSNFEKDILQFLSHGQYSLFSVIVDKKKLPKNWNEITIYKRSSREIIKNFVFALLAQKTKGKLTIESATAEKDFYYHKSAGHFLSNGFPSFDIAYSDVQNVLTEISYVTKKNNDIEEQIADLLAYGIRLKYETTRKSRLSSYEKKLIKIVESKLFKIDPKTGAKKMKFYSKIKSYVVIP